MEVRIGQVSALEACIWSSRRRRGTHRSSRHIEEVRIGQVGVVEVRIGQVGAVEVRIGKVSISEERIG